MIDQIDNNNKNILLLPPPTIHGKSEFFDMVGVSEKMRQVFKKVAMYAPSDAPVLITGETGAGKEGIASSIHKLSRRANGPFITMNCSAITDTLFESELFGHEKGSFTGAIKSHKGRFERANGGTLFLDELGDLPPLSQAKLLRALETSTIERVGSETPIKVDVRVIAATNHNLEKESLNGAFRSDLFYRLSALHIHVPPLRERIEDIEPLIQHFIELLNKKYNRNVACLTKEAIHLLSQYRWPGNVRELRNLIERLFAENQTDVIGLRSLTDWFQERQIAAQYAKDQEYREVIIPPNRQPILLGHSNQNTDDNSIITMPSKGKNITKKKLIDAFKLTGGNITEASRILGIHKATFYRTMHSLGITREDLSN
jgi:sigma-54 specific flagellar transcriptional regulator A